MIALRRPMSIQGCRADGGDDSPNKDIHMYPNFKILVVLGVKIIYLFGEIRDRLYRGADKSLA
jgi:hypothetical protein